MAEGRQAFRVGIIIPVYQHSYLLSEAVESALQQEYEPAPTIVIVSDGCPFQETHYIASSYATQHPDRVRYIYKRNGGLSSARNAGVEALMASCDAVDAFYFLDADNRIEPHAMSAYVTMMQREGADWVFPDVDQFGIKGNYSFRSPYRLSIHLDRNYCEAGSLVGRHVFEKGIRFDETMLKGFEDWEFFLNCAAHGFKGAHVVNSGFCYRKRGASMLLESEVEAQGIVSYIKEKHKSLFSVQGAKKSASEEVPTLAYVDLNHDRVHLFEDPQHVTRKLTFSAFKKLIWGGVVDPAETAPPLKIIFGYADFHSFQAHSLFRGLLWHLVTNRSDAPFNTISLKTNPSLDATLMWRDFSATAPHALGSRADLMMVKFQTLSGVLLDRSADWLRDHLLGSGNIASAELVSRDAAEKSLPQGPLLEGVLSFILALRDDEYRASAPENWYWRERSDMNTVWVDRFAGTLPSAILSFPLLCGERKSIAFVLPIIDFGGVEKVTLNVARAFKDNGWHVSLFVLGSDKIAAPMSQLAFADDVTILGPLDFSEWSSDQSFLGEAVPRGEGDTSRLLSALQNYDVVVNCHSWSLNAVMGQLKKLKVLTCSYLHLFDETVFGRYVGHVNVALAFEHAYKLLLTCSQTLADELTALGVPPSKVVALPNAAGYDKHDLAPALRLPAKPRSIADREKPRALFLGRLDRQKGLGRLSAIYQQTVDKVDWRVVGKQVLTGGPNPLPGLGVEPPIYNVNALEELYRWTDYFVLLSDFEGLPLALIEAMRTGAVPIATDVGANRELIRHGENGYLVSLENAVEEALAYLIKGSADLQRLSAAAMDEGGARNWQETSCQFLDRVNVMLPPPKAGLVPKEKIG
ncbi:MAG: glycosyltransferase [Pseudomonadota bacterium]